MIKITHRKKNEMFFTHVMDYANKKTLPAMDGS